MNCTGSTFRTYMVRRWGVRILRVNMVHLPQKHLFSCRGYFDCRGQTFLMTDSICHSSLPRTVLEKVTLTTIQFRIYPCTKVDPMFQCVYISMPLKSCPYKLVQLVLDLWRESLRNSPLCANNKGAGWSVPLLFTIARFFFRRRSSHKLKWRTEWYREFISFS